MMYVGLWGSAQICEKFWKMERVQRHGETEEEHLRDHHWSGGREIMQTSLRREVTETATETESSDCSPYLSACVTVVGLSH